MVDDTTVTEMKIKGLYSARQALEREVELQQKTPGEVRFPWRDYYDAEERVDKVKAAKQALGEIEAEIINLERDLRDPIQDGEMRAEIYAARSLGYGGNPNEDISVYFHTPLQEEKFQQRIEDQISYGYFDEDGHWEDGIYGDRYHSWDCKICGGHTDEDGAEYVAGFDTCQSCTEEAVVGGVLIGWLCNVGVYVKEDYGRGDSFNFKGEDWEDDE